MRVGPGGKGQAFDQSVTGVVNSARDPSGRDIQRAGPDKRRLPRARLSDELAGDVQGEVVGGQLIGQTHVSSRDRGAQISTGGHPVQEHRSSGLQFDLGSGVRQGNGRASILNQIGPRQQNELGGPGCAQARAGAPQVQVGGIPTDQIVGAFERHGFLIGQHDVVGGGQLKVDLAALQQKIVDDDCVSRGRAGQAGGRPRPTDGPPGKNNASGRI